MIKLNLEYSKVSINELKAQQVKVDQLHDLILNKNGEGSAFLDWLDWPETHNHKEIEAILKKVAELKANGVETLLTIGIGGSYLGGQSGIDFLKGTMDSADQVIFAGINLSSSQYKQLERKLANKKWAICVISKSGTTLEPAIAFRHFKKLLQQIHGKETNNYIVSITDGNKGALKKLSENEGYKTFVIPDGIGGRFSAITPVGLFPMAFVGIDIKAVLQGATKAKEDFTASSSLKENLAYQYAVVRNLLNKRGYVAEIFTTYDFDLTMMAEWWKQLFGESEGKDGKGLMPISVAYSRDLHSLGQIIQQGYKNFFETTLWVKNNNDDIIVEETVDNLDGLNYLAGIGLNEINKKAFDGIIDAHANTAKIPNIIIELESKSPEALGYLWYFFFISVSMSGYFLGVNPFNQPGVEIYKKNMFKLLGKN